MKLCLSPEIWRISAMLNHYLCLGIWKSFLSKLIFLKNTNRVKHWSNLFFSLILLVAQSLVRCPKYALLYGIENGLFFFIQSMLVY